MFSQMSNFSIFCRSNNVACAGSVVRNTAGNACCQCVVDKCEEFGASLTGLSNVFDCLDHELQ